MAERQTRTARGSNVGAKGRHPFTKKPNRASSRPDGSSATAELKPQSEAAAGLEARRMAVRLIEQKAAMHGKEAIRVDRWFPSSKLCSCCGHLVESMPLSIRAWTCGACGSVHDRDENAARNINAAGQAVSARRGHVSVAVPSGADTRGL